MANPKIQVDLTADAKGLKKGAKEAGDAVEKLAKDADNAADKVNKAGDKVDASGKKLSGFGDKVGGVAQQHLGPLGEIADSVGIDFDNMDGKVLAAGAGIAAIGGFAAQGVQKFTTLAESVRKVHDAAGLSFESSSKLVAISDDLGISADTVASSMGRLAKNIDAGKLDEYGIAAVRAADGTIDMAATLGTVADKMNATVDPTERAAMGAALFGKSWADMAPVLEQGSRGISKMMEAVSDGQIVTEENAQAARDWSMALDDAQDAVSELQMSMAKDMLPTLALMAKDFATAAQAVNSLKEKTGGLLDVQALANPLTQLYTVRLEDQARKADEAARAMGANTEAVAAAGLAAAAATQSATALAAATEETTQAMERQQTALLGLFNRELAADEARKGFMETLADLGTATDDYGDKLDDAKGRALSAANAQVELARQSAAAEGTTLGAAEAQQVFKGALEELRGSVEDPSLRAYLDETIGRLNAAEQAGYGAAGGFDAAAAAANRLASAAISAAAASASSAAAGVGSSAAGLATLRFAAQRSDAAGFETQRSGGQAPNVTFVVNHPIGAPNDFIRWAREELRRAERAQR